MVSTRRNSSLSQDPQQQQPLQPLLPLAPPSQPEVLHNEWSTRVEVRLSQIPAGGLGLYAAQDFVRGELVCTYGGRLVDPAEARYLDPTYIAAFEPGKGFKLVGDNEAGDVGHFANSVQPGERQRGRDRDTGSSSSSSSSNNDNNKSNDNDKQKKNKNKNKKTMMETAPQAKKAFVVIQNAKFNFTSKRYVDNNTRGRFDLVATSDIAKGDEIFVNYGNGYWTTMEKFLNNEVPTKPQTAINRDLRAQRRHQEKVTSNASASVPPKVVAKVSTVAAKNRKRAIPHVASSSKKVESAAAAPAIKRIRTNVVKYFN